MDIRAIVGVNLRRYRNQLGLSQEELADRAAIDRTYVSGVERGRRNPTVLVLDKLATVLAIEAAALLAKPIQEKRQQR